MKGARKLKRTELLLFAPFVVFVIIALFSYAREASRKQYRTEIVGKWRSQRSGLVVEIRGDGTASWVEKDGTRVTRTYEFIDDNHIRLHGPDLPEKTPIIYEVTVNNDVLKMELRLPSGKILDRSISKRVK